PPGLDLAEALDEGGNLVNPADQWREPALHGYVEARAPLPRAEPLPGPDRGVALDRHLTEVQGLEEGRDELVRRVGRHHASRLCNLLHPSRQVRRVADSGVV